MKINVVSKGNSREKRKPFDDMTITSRDGRRNMTD
jgi:hypothetical protein